jgi:ATP-dependent RNA helicase DeaD
MTDFPGVAAPLAEALRARGYETLTPVQEAVLAEDLAGRDALVSAQTGSGKTVAFGLAMAPDLLEGSDRFGPAALPLALAIAPTRELALQVRAELEWLYAPAGAVIASCVGGMDPRAERRALERGAHIVVGTPGRLRDHIERNALELGGLKAAVLDEADEMLDLGFREDLEFILDAAPTERRTLLFSATVPRSIEALAGRYQRDAARVATTAERSQHVDIEYLAMQIAPPDRDNAIINTLRYHEPKNALVFCSTRAAVNHMTARFHNRGFSVVALSGELTQNERSHALQALRDGRAQVCIATDVAARGIDLPGLELVIHADLPNSPETLLHRSGRTGRAGRKGVCALIVPHNVRRKAERLLQQAKIRAEWTAPPSADEVIARDDERLLADKALTEPAAEDDQAMIARLLAEHGPEQVAAAFLRARRDGRSAPEELRAPGEAPPRKERRDDFGDSVWISVSVGRKQNAEPRWLLPVICTGGGITKREIGAIRIQETESFVQIKATHAEKFFATVGPNGDIEKGIRIAPVDGEPDLDSRPAPEERPRKTFEKKPFEKKPFKDGGAPEKKPFKARPRRDDADRPATDAAGKWTPPGKPKGDGPARPKSGGFETRPRGAGYGGKPKPGGGYKGKPKPGGGYKGGPNKTRRKPD